MVRAVAILLPFLLPCLMAAPAPGQAPPAPVPKTGQSSCYDESGALLAGCAGTGQDGDAAAGIAWPDPRFASNGDGTVTDRLTGLSWPAGADPAGGPMTWRQALDYVRDLNLRNHLGHDDWRLPNVGELDSLANKEGDLPAWLATQGFYNVRKDYYWTSSTYSANTACAWSVGMHGGIVAGRAKGDGGFAWPVRGKPRPGGAALPRTGQTACHDSSGKAVACPGTGQDGELREGAAWPAPRFSDNGDGTVTDGLTGLAWSRDGGTPGPGVCGPGKRKTWKGALEHVGCLNANRHLGRSDWRLPNRNELSSLVHRGEQDGGAWLSSQGFSGVRDGAYWTSSTYSFSSWSAWGIILRDGAASSFAKKHRIDVWPVRGGR